MSGNVEGTLLQSFFKIYSFFYSSRLPFNVLNAFLFSQKSNALTEHLVPLLSLVALKIGKGVPYTLISYLKFVTQTDTSFFVASQILCKYSRNGTLDF